MYEKIINHYGILPQHVVAMEEMAECIKAISKVIRNPNAKDNLLEELADVQIMTEQLIEIYGVQEEIAKIKQEKFERQLKRIENDGRK